MRACFQHNRLSFSISLPPFNQIYLCPHFMSLLAPWTHNKWVRPIFEYPFSLLFDRRGNFPEICAIYGAILKAYFLLFFIFYRYFFCLFRLQYLIRIFPSLPPGAWRDPHSLSFFILKKETGEGCCIWIITRVSGLRTVIDYILFIILVV